MGRLAPVVADRGPAKDTGITSFDSLTAEAERLLVCHGVSPTRIIRYRRGEEILYLGVRGCPMTAWITQDDDGEHVATETGWPFERGPRANPRSLVRTVKAKGH